MAADWNGTDPLPVAPTIGDGLNVLVRPLLAVACWRADDSVFGFGSSFPLPAARPALARLASLVQRNPGAPLSIFGHADPTGRDDYNKTLSGRRALAIQALLARNVGAWERLFARPFGDDRWNPRAENVMRRALDDHVSNRQELFEDYMDLLCGSLKLSGGDFLAGGADAGGKGDMQGCGEFNPAWLASQAEAARFDSDHVSRNLANAPNRRVLILLFRPGSRVDPGRWPCPRVDEGPQGCRKRFWSDAPARLAPGEDERTYRATRDTFACRFYDRLAGATACEGGRLKASHRYFAWIPPSLRDRAELWVRAPGSPADSEPVLKLPASAGALDAAGVSSFDLGYLDMSKTWLVEIRLGEHRLSLGALADLSAAANFVLGQVDPAIQGVAVAATEAAPRTGRA
jgi:hypothetical protein